MNIIKESLIFMKRNIFYSISICMVLFLVLLGELLSFALMQEVKNGEQEAYNYNGFALYIEAVDGQISNEDYMFFDQIEHVTGIGGHFREITVTPIDTNNVKEHTGADVPEENTVDADNMVIVAMMDLKNYDIFRREKKITVIEGEFPDKDGIMIESRYAELNHISVGDFVNYTALDKQISLKVEGIYFVDSEFKILETNDVSDSVYIYSPYNVIYMEYEYALEVFDWIEDDRGYGCNIFIDKPENVETVKTIIEKYKGNKVNIYDNTTQYMENECVVINSLSNISRMLQISILITGTIIMLIVISFIYEKLRHDTAIYLVLGEKRIYVLLRNLIVFVLYGVLSFALLWTITFCAQDIIIYAINKMMYSYASVNNNSFNTRFIIPNIGNGFYLELDKTCIFNVLNLHKVILILVNGICISFVLPAFSTINGDPKELMK